jgi:hypothetical protein
MPQTRPSWTRKPASRSTVPWRIDLHLGKDVVQHRRANVDRQVLVERCEVARLVPWLATCLEWPSHG